MTNYCHLSYEERKNIFDRDLSCDKLLKPPYACNGCKSRSGCRKERYTYYARKADDSYKKLITSYRQETI